MPVKKSLCKDISLAWEQGELQHKPSSHESLSGHHEGLIAGQHHCDSIDLLQLLEQTFLQPLPGESPPVKQNNGEVHQWPHLPIAYHRVFR
ncbi:hypothetical protein BDL97_20G007400 [Sphagnum fallax]|nr:hypothetical protein BDL97_20G007400 [Sphagnum fallax]